MNLSPSISGANGEPNEHRCETEWTEVGRRKRRGRDGGWAGPRSQVSVTSVRRLHSCPGARAPPRMIDARVGFRLHRPPSPPVPWPGQGPSRGVEVCGAPGFNVRVWIPPRTIQGQPTTEENKTSQMEDRDLDSNYIPRTMRYGTRKATTRYLSTIHQAEPPPFASAPYLRVISMHPLQPTNENQETILRDGAYSTLHKTRRDMHACNTGTKEEN